MRVSKQFRGFPKCLGAVGMYVYVCRDVCICVWVRMYTYVYVCRHVCIRM